MADYKRIVSYMYNYENGEKRNNIGFARIEGRNGQCKITINIKAMSIKNGNLKTYIFHRDDSNIEYIYLGEVSVKNGIGDLRLTTELDQIMNSKYNLDQMGGIIIYSSDSKFFATEWDDRPIRVRDLAGINGHQAVKTNNTSESELKVKQNKIEIVEELVEDIQKEVGNDIVRNIFGNGEVHDKQTIQSESEPNEESETTTGSGTSQENGYGEYAGYSAEPIYGSNAESAQGINDDTNAAAIQNGTYESDAISNKEYANGQFGESTSAYGGANAENNTGYADYGKRERKKGYGNLRVVSPISEQTEQDYTVEAARNGEQSEFCNNQKDPDDPLNFNFYNFYTPCGGSSVEMESTDGKSPFWGNGRRTVADSVAAESVENNMNQQGNQVAANKNSGVITQDIRKADVGHPLAARIFEKFPRMKPFNDDSIVECVKIEPQDIGLFPMENWILGNNSFLLHGYYNYRHLIFAKQIADNNVKYLLGIPGVYQNREFFLAKMFGFDNFKPVMPKEDQTGEFGYWYIEIMI